MNPTSKSVYTPPRPNLGPDPLAETPPWTGIALTIAAAAAGSALLARRLRRRPKPTSPGAVVPPLAESDAPRDVMIAWSRSLREALAGRFGAAWLAKTTEELALDSTLSDALGPEVTARLLAFLADADRAKFADSCESTATPPTALELQEWAALLARPTAEPVPKGRRDLNPARTAPS